MEKYDKILMETAILWTSMSKCTRRKVCAVVAKDGRPIVNGYNGTVSGKPNTCEETCTRCNGTGVLNVMGECGETCDVCDGKGKVTNKFTLHAEQNAISYAAKNGISLDGCTMYITTSPCPDCSKLIAQSGINRVVYSDTYSDTSGIEFLKELGVDVKYYNGETNE